MTAHNTWVFNRKFGDAHRCCRIPLALLVLCAAAQCRAELESLSKSTLVDDGAAFLTYYPSVFTPLESDGIYNELESLPFDWTSYESTEGTKTESVRSPRRMAWFADNKDWVYQFSLNHKPGLPAHSWNATPALLDIKRRVESVTGVTFNACLVNIYASAQEHSDWHSDDDPWLGDLRNTTVASVSFGRPRTFSARPKAPLHVEPQGNPEVGGSSTKLVEVDLAPGSLTIMGGAFQQTWQHAVLPEVGELSDGPSEAAPTEKTESSQWSQARINLTFRRILYPERTPTKETWGS